MKTDQFSMDTFAENIEGRAILATAHENNAWHIVQRLAPVNSKVNPDGAYLIMLLNWPDGIMTRMVFNAEEVKGFAHMIQVLAGMSVFDAFETEGVVPV